MLRTSSHVSCCGTSRRVCAISPPELSHRRRAPKAEAIEQQTASSKTSATATDDEDVADAAPYARDSRFSPKKRRSLDGAISVDLEDTPEGITDVESTSLSPSFNFDDLLSSQRDLVTLSYAVLVGECERAHARCLHVDATSWLA